MGIDNSKAKELYVSVVDEFSKALEKFSFKLYDIDIYEKVFVVEDSFIVYLGLINYYPGNSFNGFHAVFEEFSYNEIFKFNVSAFSRKFAFGFVKYYKFNGTFDQPLDYRTEWDGTSYKISHINVESNFNKTNTALPKLNILDRYNQWDGFFYNYIVFELAENEKKGYAIYRTNSPLIHSIAQKKCRDVEYSALEYYGLCYVKCGFCNKSYYKGVESDKTMVELLIARIEKGKALGWVGKRKTAGYSTLILAENALKYFFIPMNIKGNLSGNQDEMSILDAVREGKYDSAQRYDYLEPENKWKSEQRVYELTKQLFKHKIVLYQHRPSYLRSVNGQMSYDIFVCGENIAIEYQGKQHFEPVTIFGGIEHFESQIERDKLKKDLSDFNGVKLIYINYWEDISIDLIKQRIDETSVLS